MSCVNITASALQLAYMGDAVFELMVRDMLLKTSMPVSVYSNEAKKYVSAQKQSVMYFTLLDKLTDEEAEVIKRGRNAFTKSRPRSASVSEYRHATGLEALFGYLHLQGKYDRIEELFKICVGAEGTMTDGE